MSIRRATKTVSGHYCMHHDAGKQWVMKERNNPDVGGDRQAGNPY